ncbi:hypothetical protein GCM10009548_08730 [Streptomyces malaysiensis subsp. malaysiensis]
MGVGGGLGVRGGLSPTPPLPETRGTPPAPHRGSAPDPVHGCGAGGFLPHPAPSRNQGHAPRPPTGAPPQTPARGSTPGPRLGPGSGVSPWPRPGPGSGVSPWPPGPDPVRGSPPGPGPDLVRGSPPGPGPDLVRGSPPGPPARTRFGVLPLAPGSAPTSQVRFAQFRSASKTRLIGRRDSGWTLRVRTWFEDSAPHPGSGSVIPPGPDPDRLRGSTPGPARRLCLHF